MALRRSEVVYTGVRNVFCGRGGRGRGRGGGGGVGCLSVILLSNRIPLPKHGATSITYGESINYHKFQPVSFDRNDPQYWQFLNENLGM